MFQRVLFFLIVLGGVFSPLQAKPKIPLALTVFDAGIYSAETLGRGGTVASNRDSPAAGSENPASLISAQNRTAVYTTILLKTSSRLPSSTIRQNDPLSNKVLHYLSIQAEKGNLFFEPLGREDQEIIFSTSPLDVQNIEFSANALGFSGADRWRAGSMGLSLSYLWATLGARRSIAGMPTQNTLDTGNGVRLNVGLRYPTGPAMWGLFIQNAPGFVWWKDFKRTMLPLRIRAGNTWRIQPGILLSIDGERRYYNEGGATKDFVYIGNEMLFLKHVSFRAGVFSDRINRPSSRHWTTGLTMKETLGTEISYGLEVFTLNNEKVKRSFVSVRLPFATGGDQE